MCWTFWVLKETKTWVEEIYHYSGSCTYYHIFIVKVDQIKQGGNKNPDGLHLLKYLSHV